MKFAIERKHGLLILVLMSIFRILGSPINCFHERLKRLVCSPFLKTHLWRGWETKEIEGVYIELWALSWLTLNTFLFLPQIAGVHSCLVTLYMAIIVSRAADLLWASSAMNFLLSRTSQRSLPRSFLLLGLVFFEMAAIISAFHFFPSTQFKLGSEIPTWKNVYFYTVRNMLTVGGGEIAVSDVTDTFSVFYYGALRIIQPLFTVFLVTLGINQILNGKRETIQQDRGDKT